MKLFAPRKNLKEVERWNLLHFRKRAPAIQCNAWQKRNLLLPK
jgi:hypothetical protein